MTCHTRILFVCSGNICRSPTAEAVFRRLVDKAGLSDNISCDSAGTYGLNAGSPPDKRAQKVALQHGYDLSNLVSRAVDAADFENFDYIFAMDTNNHQSLLEIAPKHYHGKIHLLLKFSEYSRLIDVPDPFLNGELGFIKNLEIIEDACNKLLTKIS